jgi:hypothetical protein
MKGSMDDRPAAISVDRLAGRAEDARMHRLPIRHATLLVLAVLTASSPRPAAAAEARPGYATVASRKTAEDRGWRPVIDALVAKHGGTTLLWEAAVEDVLPRLREARPRFACFVARPEEVSREFVARVRRLCRRLDGDPYPDCLSGIVTARDPATAIRIASLDEPLTVRRIASGTEVALEMCEEGVWYCELKQGRMARKEKGGQPREEKAPPDTTEALAKALTEYRADLFVTSGHATERDWQIGYAYRNGQFRCEGGSLYGLDTAGRRIPIVSPNPKVYLPVGNCLMGHIDGLESMALAFLGSAGVDQMIGYTVPTWYGYAGWGILDYFVEQPGRFSLSEAVFANESALIHRLTVFFPESLDVEDGLAGSGRPAAPLSARAREAGLTANDGRGLLHDRDVLAFYGDPAWIARMAPGPVAWDQVLTETDGVWTLEIRPNRGERTFEPIDRNGSQRGGRPIVQFLPRRIGQAAVLEGGDLSPVIADDFVLVPLPARPDPARKYRVVFRAKPVREF